MTGTCPTPRSFSILRSLLLTVVLFTGLSSPASLSADPVENHHLSLEPLHLFYGGKLGLSFLLAGTAITSPEAGMSERAIVAGSSLLLAIPSSSVWYHSRRGNAQTLQQTLRCPAVWPVMGYT
jgi:hypothetical protein